MFRQQLYCSFDITLSPRGFGDSVLFPLLLDSVLNKTLNYEVYRSNIMAHLDGLDLRGEHARGKGNNHAGLDDTIIKKLLL